MPAGNGWSIANEGTSKPGSLSWRVFTNSRTPLIRINALNPVVRMNVERSGTTTANLNIKNYTTAWWYKRTAPSGDNTCHSIAAGTTAVALTGIVNNTAYTYKAYATAGCDSDALLATLSFTPKPLYVSGIGATVAALSFTGQSGTWYYQANKAPHASCQGPVSGDDATLTGLTAGTNYRYTAYSNANCTGTAATTEAAFSTPASGSSQGASADITALPPLGSRHQAAEINLVLGPTGVTAPAASRPGYVSNLNSVRSGDSDIDTAYRQAVRFTTGPNPDGYTLTQFTAALRKLSGAADLVLTLHAGAPTPDGDDPQPAETVLATLTSSDPPVGAFTDIAYTCAGIGCQLAPDTTYFVVAESLGPGAYAWATIVSAALLTETTEPANSGWAIGPGSYAADSGEWTNWGDWHHARIDFTPIGGQTFLSAPPRPYPQSGQPPHRATTGGCPACAAGPPERGGTKSKGRDKEPPLPLQSDWSSAMRVFSA